MLPFYPLENGVLQKEQAKILLTTEYRAARDLLFPALF